MQKGKDKSAYFTVKTGFDASIGTSASTRIKNFLFLVLALMLALCENQTQHERHKHKEICCLDNQPIDFYEQDLIDLIDSHRRLATYLTELTSQTGRLEGQTLQHLQFNTLRGCYILLQKLCGGS